MSDSPSEKLTIGKLTTNVLDTAAGAPAAGMKIELWRMMPTDVQHVSTQFTNDDGRTESPFLLAETMVLGVYELRFSAGDYFAETQPSLPDPPFLDWVPIRFGIADVTAHYHVPLLVSSWSYSTYRGS